MTSPLLITENLCSCSIRLCKPKRTKEGREKQMKDSQGDAIDFLPGRRGKKRKAESKGRGRKERQGKTQEKERVQLQHQLDRERGKEWDHSLSFLLPFFSLTIYSILSILCYSTKPTPVESLDSISFWVYEPAPAVSNIRTAAARTNRNREYSDSKRDLENEGAREIVRKKQHSKNIHQSFLPHFHSRELSKDTFSVRILSLSHSPYSYFSSFLDAFTSEEWIRVDGTKECIQEGRQENKERMFMTCSQGERAREIDSSEKKEPKKIEWE